MIVGRIISQEINRIMSIGLKSLLFVNHLTSISIEDCILPWLDSEFIAKSFSESPNIFGSHLSTDLNIMLAEDNIANR